MKKEDARNLYSDAIKSCESGKEIWTDCYYSGRKLKGYQVSNFGNVRSFWQKKMIMRNKKGAGCVYLLGKTPTLLKGKICKEYKKFILKLSGVRGVFRANRLVMDSFCFLEHIPPKHIPEDIWDSTHISVKKLVASGLVVNHKDHIKDNNRIVNLEYITQVENAKSAKDFYNGN